MLTPTASGQEPPEAPAPPELRSATRTLKVRPTPSAAAPVVGFIAPDEPFIVHAQLEGPDCEALWGALDGGFVCLTDTEVASEGAPAPLPRLIVFDPPSPDEHAAYVRDGRWPRDPDTADALLPFVYGKVWRHWRGTQYASVAAWEQGESPVESLEEGRSYHFMAVAETSRGAVLARPDGEVVPLDDVFIYPVSRFHGVELGGGLVPGDVAAWVTATAGANLRDAPGLTGAVDRLIPFQAALVVRATDNPRWFEVPDALGPGIPGYVADSVLGRARVMPPPEALAPDALWIDVDIDEQVLMLMQGEAPIFATLVSTGQTERDTPRGVYALMDKTIYGDMASLPDAEEPYHVERVPWVMHFRPRYALHGTFWHWSFGNRASHGCVNLAPLDAKRVFDAVSPRLPEAWSTAFASAEQPGTTVRIR